MRASSLYESEAWVLPGSPPQPEYLNAVVEVPTTLAPERLLGALLAIERRHGRTRTPGQRWAPRQLDLDLVLYGDLATSRPAGPNPLEEPALTVPHPELTARPFVLVPLAELCPDRTVPGTGATVAELCSALAEAPLRRLVTAGWPGP